MIFKTQNDELGRMEIKPNQNLLSIFNGDFFKRQQLLSESDIKAIEAYNAEIDKCVGSQTAFYRTMQNTSQEAQNVVAAANGGKVAIGDLTKASKAGELGMKALAMAGNMLVSFLIGSFISVAFEVANASNEIADSAQQIGSSFKETISDLDDYQIKVEDLQETINDSSSSISDVRDARKELMSIQDELIEKYGTEEESVKHITDAVNGEADAWDKLKKKKWTRAKNEFDDTGKDGILKGLGRNISNFFNGYTNNTDRMKKEYGDYSVDISTGNITGDKNRKQAEEILSKFGELTNSANNSAVKQLTIKGNAEDVYNTLLNIQSVFNDLNNDSIGRNSSFVTELGNMANDADEVVQEYQDFWTEYVLNEEILSKGSKYTSTYKDILDDYDKYQKALEDGNQETIDDTKQTLIEALSDAMDTAEANGDDDIVSFFQDMYPDIKAEVASWRFEVKFDANTDGLKDEVKDPLKVLKGFSSDELKSDVFDPNKATKEQQDAYNTLISVADQYGLTIDDLIEKLQKMGLLSSDAEKLYDKTVKRFKAGSNSKKKNLDEAEQNLQNEYDKITGKNGQRNFQLGAYEKQIKNGTLQSKFGNVDMDKRTIIEWSNELKKTYKDELDSWDYDPEIGSIDTVRGGSERFGEDLNGTGWEIAFTPILPDGTFLSSDTVHKYINKILEKAYANDGKVTEDELTKIDAEGIKVGNTFVHGIFAGIDDSEEYDNNGNWAEVVGRLMHFSGDSGAISLAKKGIEKAKKFFGQDDQSKIEKFLKSEGLTSKADIEYFNKVTSDATSAAEAIKMYNAAKKKKKEADQEDSTTQYSSFKQGWKDLDDPTDDTFKNTKSDLNTLAKAGQLTQKTFNKVPGAKKWAESFKELGLSTKDVIDRINKMQTASDQLSSMKSGISSISSVLAEKKDNTKHKKTRNVGIGADTLAGFDDTIKDLKTWKEFEKTLGNGESSMADCQKVANKLATEWVNSNNFLANLNGTNQEYYKSTLREMGVVNANAVVHKAWVQIAKPEKDVKEELKNEGKELADATWEDVYGTKAYSNASKEAQKSLQYLYAQENILANSDLGLQEKVNQLSDFIKKTLGAAEASKIAAEAFHQVALAETGGKDTLWYQKQYNKNYIDQYNKKMNKINLGVKVTPNPTSSGSGSKQGKTKNNKSKDSKQEIDWIARKLEVLQKAIDTTSGKLQNLFSIKAKKNNINKQITETTKLLNANRKAAKAYTAEANKVKLGGKLKAKVRSGDYDITKYSSKTADKINKYQDLIDKAREAQDAVQDNIASIHDLNQQKLDNITTWYDKLLDRINAITSKFQTKTDLTAKIRGMLGKSETGTTTEYNNTLSSQNNALKTSRNEYNKYNAERKEQRSKLIGDNKSNRKATKEFLERSGLSKKQIAKEMKKFDKKNDLTKELEDFDATTEAQAAKLKENIWSAMSDMLETAQALANVPMEKLNVALDNLDTKFSSLEKSANRASTQLENVGTGLDYFIKTNQSQLSIKNQEISKARKTLSETVNNRDVAQNELIKRGINPSTITDSTSLESVVNALGAKSDYEGINWATKYLASISAVDDAYKKVINLTEDYRDTVDSLAESLVSAEDKLADKNRDQDTKEHERDEKKWAYTDDSKSDRLATITANLLSDRKNYESYFTQADKRKSQAAAQAQQVWNWANFSRADGYWRSDEQKALIQSLATWAEKVQTFDPNTDDVGDFYLSEEVQKQIAQGISEGWMHPDMASYVANANQYLLSSNTAAENGKDAKATYDYETVGQSFKDIFSIITNEADRSVTTVQRNIDAIENSLEDNLLTDKSDSYKREATNYQTQKDISNNEVAELKQQLAIAESQGLKKGSDTWNELMDQIHTAEDNAAKAAQSYTEAIVNAFNAVGDVADRKVTEIGKSLSKLDTQISLYEAQGHFITSDFYSSEGDYYQQQQDAQLKKAADLQAELDADVASGDIKEYSARWYEMKDKIDEASQSAAECGVKVAEATKNAFDAILQMGEKSREAISRMNDEADFYQDILGRDKTVDDKTGAFTENGVASISLSYEKMTNDMVLTNKIKEQIDAVKARFNNGNNPEYGVEKYNEDMDNLLSQQREAIKNYYDEREAVMSLVQDGLEKQLECLQKIIDKYKEAMNKASDLRDYQNNVDEATKNIASLEKQLEVIKGNDSEEGRATAQSLQKQLEEAQKNLDDLEWDKKKSDMEEILDNLYEDAQDFVEEKLTQITDSIDQIRDLLPENAKVVSDTLTKIDDAWGTRMSEHFSDAVKLGDYSTITSTIESSAEKIANNVYAVEQALLQRTPAPDSTIDSGSHSGNSGSTGTGSSTSGTTNGSSQNTVTPKPKVASENDLKSIVKKYLINGAIPTYNEESNARKSLDALTYDATGDGTLFSDKLHMSGKIPDSNVPKLLTALGLDKATAMPLSMQIAALESELRKRIKMGGFSKGGIIEQINKQVRSNGDDVIISAKDGEGILTPQQTAMMQKFISEMPSLVSISDIKTPALPVAQNTAKTVNVELGDMHFDLPNVTDTDSFINAWKTDNKMKNFVSDVVAGAVTGDNSKAMRY